MLSVSLPFVYFNMFKFNVIKIWITVIVIIKSIDLFATAQVIQLVKYRVNL